MAGIDVDAEVRALYQGPFEEFVAERRALGRQLKLAGHARRGEVEALRKPPVSAWGVNRLFAVEPKAMAALVATGERARAAQSVARAGADPRALRDALATLRGEVERLTARGVELLTAGDKPPGEAIVERLRASLEALAYDPATAEVAARGWLDDDLPAPGFELMAALQLAAMGGGGGTSPGRAGRPARPARPSRATPGAAAPTATVHDFADARKRREREAHERRERARRERIEKLAEEANRLEAEAAKRMKAAAEADRAAAAAAEEARLATDRAAAAQAFAAGAAERAEGAAAAARKAREALTAAMADEG